MQFLGIFIATVVAFAAGAVWYMTLARPWMAAVGIPVDAEGKPQSGMDPKVMALTFVMQLVVAGMMHHVFALSGIVTIGAGLIGGLGVGLFFIAPWIALTNANAGRPLALTMIDGGYATLACTLMGGVLTLFL